MTTNKDALDALERLERLAENCECDPSVGVLTCPHCDISIILTALTDVKWKSMDIFPKDGADFEEDVDFIALAKNTKDVSKCFIGHFESDGFYFAEGGELDAWNWDIIGWQTLPALQTD